MEQNLKFSTLLKEFKKENNLDFRINKYFDHSYFYNFKRSTYFSYDFAKNIIINLNDFLEKKFNKKLIIYNFDIEIESLKTQKLETYIFNRINDYIEINCNFWII